MDREQILAELVRLNRPKPQAPDEFTAQEYVKAEGIAVATARQRLARWEQLGFVTSRPGVRQEDSHRVRYYRVVDLEGLRAFLETKPRG